MTGLPWKETPDTTWREEIEKARKDAHDNSPWVHNTLTEDELDVMFDSGYGGSRGKPFTAWSVDRVYFPVVYDGAEWAKSVPRNPCDEDTYHVGGE